MKVRTIEYYIREVFISLRRNNWMSVASIGTVAVSLFIFGISDDGYEYEQAGRKHGIPGADKCLSLGQGR